MQFGDINNCDCLVFDVGDFSNSANCCLKDFLTVNSNLAMSKQMAVEKPASDKVRIVTRKDRVSIFDILPVQRENWRVKEAREICDLDGIDDYEIVKVMESTGYDSIKYIPLLTDLELRRKKRSPPPPKVQGFLREKAKQLRETVTMNSKIKQEIKISLPEFSERGMAMALRWMLNNLNQTVNYTVGMTTTNPDLVRKILWEYEFPRDNRRDNGQLQLQIGPDVSKTFSSGGSQTATLRGDWKEFFVKEAKNLCETNATFRCNDRVSSLGKQLGRDNIYRMYVMYNRPLPPEINPSQAVKYVKYGQTPGTEVYETDFSKLKRVSSDDLKNFRSIDGKVVRAIEQHLFCWHLTRINPEEILHNLFELTKRNTITRSRCIVYMYRWLFMFPRDFVDMKLPDSLPPPTGENVRMKLEANTDRAWDVFKLIAPQYLSLEEGRKSRPKPTAEAVLTREVEKYAGLFANRDAVFLRTYGYDDIVKFVTERDITSHDFIVRYFTQVQATVDLIVNSLKHSSEDGDTQAICSFWLDLGAKAAHSLPKNFELAFEIGLALASPAIANRFPRHNIEKFCQIVSRLDGYIVLTSKMGLVLTLADKSPVICIFPYLLWLVWLQDKIFNDDETIEVQNADRALELAKIICRHWGKVTNQADPIKTFEEGLKCAKRSANASRRPKSFEKHHHIDG